MKSGNNIKSGVSYRQYFATGLLLASLTGFTPSRGLEVITLGRASLDSAEIEGNQESNGGNVSSLGGFVSFHSLSTNLSTPAGSTTFYDVYLRDVALGTTEIISIDNAGNPGNNHSGFLTPYDLVASAVTENGAFVVYPSLASNLVATDTNGSIADIFLKDRTTNTTTIISHHSNGTAADGASREPQITDNGRYIVYTSKATNLVDGDTQGFEDIFLYDRDNDTTVRVSQTSATAGTGANAKSWAASISLNGDYVVFNSAATNLVANDNNGGRDVFLYEVATGNIERISVDSNENEVPAILMLGTDPELYPSEISDDGRYVVFEAYNSFDPSDTDGIADVYLRDRQLGTTTLISTGNWVLYNTPSISGNGQYISFDGVESGDPTSFANETWDSFIYEVATGESLMISQTTALVHGDRSSWGTRLSSDGKTLVFNSRASNLDVVVPDGNGQFDVFVASVKGSFPILNDDVFTVRKGSTTSLNVLQNDKILDVASLITSYTQPSMGTLALSNGVLTYTAPEGVLGKVYFNYTVCDSFNQCTSARVTLIIAADLGLARSVPSLSWAALLLSMSGVLFAVRHVRKRK